MSPLAEKAVLFVLKFLTPELIQGAEQDLVAFLRALSAKSPGKVDDALVELLAVALGVK